MGGIIISVMANLVLFGLVILATYMGYKKYDKKLLEGKVISQKQILTAIIGALFASMIGVFVLNFIKIFLFGDTLVGAILGLGILVAQFFIIYYMLIFILKQQKIGLEKKVSQMLARRLSFIIMISLVLINIGLVLLSIFLDYMTM